jgi:hypothetical protein
VVEASGRPALTLVRPLSASISLSVSTHIIASHGCSPRLLSRERRPLLWCCTFLGAAKRASDGDSADAGPQHTTRDSSRDAVAKLLRDQPFRPGEDDRRRMDYG